MAAGTSKCTFGNVLHLKCHMKKYTRLENIRLISDLTDEEKKLLSWRAEINIQELQTSTARPTICDHHKHFYLDNYATTQSKCCDPLIRRHKTSKKGT